jgi:uncharacterized protein (DUF1330 family)
MAYYFAANIRVHDPEIYQKYLEQSDEIFGKFNGEYLAVDEAPVLLEGKWNYSKSVLIRFQSNEDFEKWYYSDEYQEILKFRLDASESDSILIRGKD